MRRARTLYGRRRQALIDALERHLGDRANFVDSRAGLHLLVRIEGLAARELPALHQSASERGVRIYPGAICYATPPEHAELLLGFTRLSESEIDAGISRLAEVLAR